ncbi:UDP-glucose--hexose-1-phosphate uridylyltransferase [Evansella tamaricis]|uniref:Galactose-1-phosphate uridylyltransferase n=1 Tax=Evansella tamaricis TaxID=2069301 RepID=A0ABS6JHY9_9BACI|nr:UDP-glucose--hexose-1-phosphate uridylyltransferase [Evansella tamaricis]MBU9712839.1 UDP-glucose--hexose-1-phosphate uridylyltransferase [Evansella tamaricis]
MKDTIDVLLEKLLRYALTKQLIENDDLVYCRNQLIGILEINKINPIETEIDIEEISCPSQLLNPILDWAFETGRLKSNTVTERDLLDTRLMGVLTNNPSVIISKFKNYKTNESSKKATAWFYKLSKDNHYIRQNRIKKNVHWMTETNFGDLELTINLSKPEKDPREIEAAKQEEKVNYPLCLLCKENEGFFGRINHPARQNLRTIPVVLNGENWRLQFSPYVYYHEHAIIFSEKHVPMKITKATFQRLIDFVGLFPHYFIGSNADLPIVGGSILSHDHFQGGYHQFPMERAEQEEVFEIPSLPGVKVGKVKWPMSVLRITGAKKTDVVNAAFHIFNKWKNYNDQSVEIHSHTNETPHNTVTPIARMENGLYQVDIVLRNNRTTEKYPVGIFHPHQEVHHIKKENIGLIEVMGLAVLPGRLIDELNEIEKALLSENPEKEIWNRESITKHREWALQLLEKYPNLNQDNCGQILQVEVGKVFSNVLEHAGVFKRDSKGQMAFRTFIESL